MKVFVVMDHICEADILVGVFSSKEKAKDFLKLPPRRGFGFGYEGPEIVEEEIDNPYGDATTG